MAKAYVDVHIGKKRVKVNVKDIRRLTIFNKPKLPRIPQ